MRPLRSLPSILIPILFSPPSLPSLPSPPFSQVAWNRLSGPIPAGVNGWENVTYLDLSQNTLSDSIPVGLSVLTNLQRL